MKLIRIILWVVICVVFFLGLVMLINGSLEAFPTPEQQEKTRIAAVALMLASLSLGGVMIYFKRK